MGPTWRKDSEGKEQKAHASARYFLICHIRNRSNTVINSELCYLGDVTYCIIYHSLRKR